MARSITNKNTGGIIVAKTYKDKHGAVIKEGDEIMHKGGQLGFVVACSGPDGEDLGISASNQDYMDAHPQAEEQFYPLSEFFLSDWEIVQPDPAK